MNIIKYLQNHSFYFLLIISFFGLCVGSFLNVLIYRLPIMLKNSYKDECIKYLKNESPISSKIFNLFLPRSHCPKCNHLIASWHNIPIISFILLQGKCTNCKGKIPWRYPAVELISYLASLLIAYKFGAHIQTAAILLLTWALIAAIFIDIDHQLLPDNLTIPLLWFGLLLNTQNIFVSAKDAIIGAILGYLSLWLIAYAFKLVRKIEGMGHGDFKLLALFGAWFGWQALPFIIFFASVAGSIVGIAMIIAKKHHYEKPIPFGPFLAITGWSVVFLQPANMLTLYLKLFGFW